MPRNTRAYYFGYPSYIGAGVVAAGIAFGTALGDRPLPGQLLGRRLQLGQPQCLRQPPHHQRLAAQCGAPDRASATSNASVQQRPGNNNVRAGASNRMDFRGKGGQQVLQSRKGPARAAAIAPAMPETVVIVPVIEAGTVPAIVLPKATIGPNTADRGANRGNAGNRAAQGGGANCAAAANRARGGGGGGGGLNVSSGRAAERPQLRARGRASFASSGGGGGGGGGFRGGGGGGGGSRGGGGGGGEAFGPRPEARRRVASAISTMASASIASAISAATRLMSASLRRRCRPYRRRR